jgi:hypothetical protein
VISRTKANLSRAAAAPHSRSLASLADARARIEAWRMDYDRETPYTALGHLTPKE